MVLRITAAPNLLGSSQEWFSRQRDGVLQTNPSAAEESALPSGTSLLAVACSPEG